jgi:serine/threonine protein phosphatase PrpC
MEDVDFIFEAVRVTDQRSVGVYGVLDGHGGKECGTYHSSTPSYTPIILLIYHHLHTASSVLPYTVCLPLSHFCS